jgi:aryl-phospho-beta-D-glucosidase BglC (GH1 family)
MASLPSNVMVSQTSYDSVVTSPPHTGFDNSGRRGPANWATQQSNIDRTKAVIQSIAEEFSDPQYYGVVTAIGLLNEPAGYLNSQLLNAARQYSSESFERPWRPQDG